jgi:hypothetical protein
MVFDIHTVADRQAKNVNINIKNLFLIVILVYFVLAGFNQ